MVFYLWRIVGNLYMIGKRFCPQIVSVSAWQIFSQLKLSLVFNNKGSLWLLSAFQVPFPFLNTAESMVSFISFAVDLSLSSFSYEQRKLSLIAIFFSLIHMGEK